MHLQVLLLFLKKSVKLNDDDFNSISSTLLKELDNFASVTT